MGELAPGIKQKLHDLVEASDTDEILIIVSAICENDLDNPLSKMIEFTPSQMRWLKNYAARIGVGDDVATIVRYVLDSTIRGARDAEMKALMSGAEKDQKKKAKGKRG